LACVKQKQKNFKCSVKVVKFINDKLVILGTNHGQILGYKFNVYNTDEKNNLIIFYEDKEARVVNSMDFIILLFLLLCVVDQDEALGPGPK